MKFYKNDFEIKKLMIMSVILALFYAAILYRLILLQVKEYKKYSILANENRLKLKIIHAPRGNIYDKTGRLLVDNVASFVMYAIPFNTKKNIYVLDKVDSLVKIHNLDKIKKIIKFAPRYKPILLKKDLSIDKVSYLLANQSDFPGIIISIEPKRRYIYDNLASHIIGYVGDVDKKIILNNVKYVKGDNIGKYGLEKFYEKYLHGKNGVEYLEVTARGKILGKISDKKISPIAGNNLYITIDYNLQSFIEKEFPEDYNGAVVVLENKTGKIVGLVSKPEYNPNNFVYGISKENWDKMKTLPHIFQNAAIELTYPPGSVFKPLTGLVGLEDKKITKSTVFQACTGVYNYKGHKYKCWNKYGHGVLDLIGAITHSCNIYFYQLGERLPLDRIYYYETETGFGRKTMIDFPKENPGLIPNTKWYNEHYGRRNWGSGVKLSLAIGQGEIGTTLLQVADFYAAIANNGYYFTPHFLKKITDSSDKMTIKTYKSKKHFIPFSKTNIDIIKKGLYDVVNSKHGTAYRSHSNRFIIAGKTGTAQNPHGKDHGWFASFAPYDDPELVVVVMIEHGGHGGTLAAPLAKKIFEYYLPKYRLAKK